MGIEDDAYRWYKSYLENRKVTVIISNEKLEIKSLTKGVTQDSVLGPLLFGIYTIELSKILWKHNIMFNLYADNTQFYFLIDTIEDATKKIDEIIYLYTLAVSPSLGGSQQHKGNNKNNVGFTSFFQQ